MKKTNKQKVKKSKLVKIKSKQPDFNPGSTPYAHFGNDILNKDVPWHLLVSELLKRRESVTSIATYVDCGVNTVNDILTQKFSGLNFRSGARLVTLHYNVCRTR